MAGNPPNDRNLFGDVAAAESLRVISKLADAGFVAYLAGGCVRDALLGRHPKDFDVATNATPESVREIFGHRSTLAFGASFGVIAVLPPNDARSGNAGEVIPTEVATFRSDGDYSDGRRPDSVKFGSADEDAQRRDFTINGMFYDPIERRVIDFVGGQEDLKLRRLRTIGNPADRFDEDKLRMLRAVRFATTLRLDVDEDTVRAIQNNASQIEVVSGERIGAEMRKVLSSPHAASGLLLLARCGLTDFILPQLAEFDASSAASALASLEERDVATALGCLLLHHPESVTALSGIAKQWKLSNEEIRRCKSALLNTNTVLGADELPWSQLQPVLMDRDIDAVVQVAKAIVISRAESEGLASELASGLAAAGVQRSLRSLAWPAEKLNPLPLLTGDDLRREGFAAGPIFKQILSEIRRAQLDGEISTPEQASEMAKAIAQQG